jgi:DNA-binding transcriptional LysR family regulator
VDNGSFATAANRLDMSRAMASKSVAALEEHLGTRLLNRTTRKLSLTETGHAYLERVNRILADVDDAEAVAAAHSKKPAGTLRIYSQLGFGKQQLAELLPLFADANPDVVLDVTLSDRTVDLVEEGYDAGIFTVLQKFDASMISRQLGVAEVLMCASPGYIKRHGMPRTPDDVTNHACLNFSNVDLLRHHWPISSDTETVNIPIRSRMLSNNSELLRRCAAADMGIVVGPSYSMVDDIQSKRLVRLLGDHHLGQIAVMMVYPSRRQLSAKVRSFIDFMNAHFPHPENDPWADG